MDNNKVAELYVEIKADTDGATAELGKVKTAAEGAGKSFALTQQQITSLGYAFNDFLGAGGGSASHHGHDSFESDPSHPRAAWVTMAPRPVPWSATSRRDETPRGHPMRAPLPFRTLHAGLRRILTGELFRGGGPRRRGACLRPEVVGLEGRALPTTVIPWKQYQGEVVITKADTYVFTGSLTAARGQADFKYFQILIYLPPTKGTASFSLGSGTSNVVQAAVDAGAGYGINGPNLTLTRNHLFSNQFNSPVVIPVTKQAQTRFSMEAFVYGAYSDIPTFGTFRLVLDVKFDNAPPPPPSSKLPDVVMTQATTTDAQNVTASYTVNTADVTKPLGFKVYRSASATGYRAADQIGTATLPASDRADLSVGTHRVKLTLPAGALLPDPTRPFVIVVANPDNSVPESDTSNDSAYYQTFMVGVVSHGFTLPGTTPPNSVPVWESQMAAALKASDRYDTVIAFNWVSDSYLPVSGKAVGAGQRLAAQVNSLATGLESRHPGDVVDLHFIGHSRGTVVVSQAVMALETTYPSAIAGSYIKMTLLDPHPAMNFPGANYLSFQGVGGNSKNAAVTAFQLLAVDPAVVVPDVVNAAEVYYQHSDAANFPASNDESSINLWGHGDHTIVNKSKAVVKFTDLTNRTYSTVGVIGHSEVPLYYLYTVVNTGKTLTG